MKTRKHDDERTVAYPEELLASLRGRAPSSAPTRALARPPAAPKSPPAQTEVDRPQAPAQRSTPRVRSHARPLVTAVAGVCALAALVTALVSKGSPDVGSPRAPATTTRTRAPTEPTHEATSAAPVESPTQDTRDEGEDTLPADEATNVSADVGATVPASASPADAARLLASGDRAAAHTAYRALARTHSDKPVFATIARVLAARRNRVCEEDGAGETSCR
jgi:hypothetical protein